MIPPYREGLSPYLVEIMQDGSSCYLSSTRSIPAASDDVLYIDVWAVNIAQAMQLAEAWRRRVLAKAWRRRVLAKAWRRRVLIRRSAAR